MCTLEDYSRPSHEGYRNTIELPKGNNVVPLRSDTIWLVQNGCSFHGLRSEDPNQHLKDFLKLVDSLDLNAGSITTWEDLTTRFLAQFFPSGWTEIIENLALYDDERWNDLKDFVKSVKAISTPQSASKTPNRRLLELEDQINFLLKGSRPTPRPSSMQVPQAYAEAVYLNPRLQNQNEPLKQNPFTFHERTGPNPQPQALETTFEARVQDYMAVLAKRIERLENAIFKQPEVINNFLKPTNRFQLKGALPRVTVKNPLLNVNSTSLVLSACSCPTEDPQCSTQIHSSINTITICPECPGKLQNSKPEEEEQEEKDNSENINTDPSLPPDPSISFINEKNDDSHKEEPEVGENARVGELEMEYFDIFPTMNELAYHKLSRCGPSFNISEKPHQHRGNVLNH
ncbi:hypothetical protein Tco_0163120 [Tanacetum coccineum]